MTTRFNELSDFISNQMRMSHIYQPAMLMELLSNGGVAGVSDIAKALLVRDNSQVEYYEQITKNMVGRVLTKNRGLTARHRDAYSLIGHEELSEDEVNKLIGLCADKINEYVGRRGDRIWSHRKKSAGYISGTLRYEVLKRAKSRCELCGISNQEKALEVDHIIPRNFDGTDDLANLQALCYSCNAMKRDRDDTDFRGVVDSYKHRRNGCRFCGEDTSCHLSENELCYSIDATNPLEKNHILIIPKRHVTDFFELYRPETNAALDLLDVGKRRIESLDRTVQGFNIRMETGGNLDNKEHHCSFDLIPIRA